MPNRNALELYVAISGRRTPKRLPVEVQDLVIAGWTGRDETAIARHIAELEAIGVARPKRTPMFYCVSAHQLTIDRMVDVIGKNSTGEVEFVLFQQGRDLYVGLGSDHTDRKAEAVGVTLSKQMCPKPIAAQLWRWCDVESHWDELALRCIARTGSEKVLYQEGSVMVMLHPKELLARYAKEGHAKMKSGTAMFCGTLAAKNKINWADHYELELIDPVLKRRIRHAYSVRSLPIVD